MQLGALEYLISVNDSGVKSGIDRSERTIKSSAARADKSLRDYGNKISAWTIAKGTMIANVTTRVVKTLASTTKQAVKSVVDGFADFEQVEGGAKLIWGDTFGFIEKRAKEAYKNVQMSATDYMQQANNYAVGLKTSLDGDTEAAAQLADRIITAQADVVAALGIDAERVQSAFQGVMRGNYTMLDNLQLGIKATQQGMKDVIKQVNDWNKANGKATKYQMGNLADMQSALIDYIDMQGLSGYAAGEAADTIQGAMASAKSAWKDLLVAMGNGRDVKRATKQFTTSLANVFKNVAPVAKNAIKNIFEAAKEALPTIRQAINDVWNEFKRDLPKNGFLSKVSEKIDGIFGTFKLLTDLMSDYEGTMDTLQRSDSPLLRGVGTAIDLVHDFSSKIEEAINREDSLLMGLLSGSADFLVDAMDKFSDWLANKGGAEKVAGVVTKIVESIANVADKLAEPLSKVLSQVLTSETTWNAVIKLAAALGDALFDTLIDVGASVLDIFNKDWGAELRKLKRLGQPEQEPNVGDTTPDGRTVTGTSTTSDGGKLTLLGHKETKTTATGYDGPTLKTAGPKTEEERRAVLAYNTFREEEIKAIENDITKAISDSVLKGKFRPGDRTGTMRQHIIDDWVESGKLRLYSNGEMAYSSAEKRKEIAEKIGMTEVPVEPVLEDPAAARDGLQNSIGTLTVPAVINPFGFSWGGKGDSNAKGNWSVPYDNFPALLHRDEMVLTKSQARKYRDGEGGADSAMIGTAIASAVQQAMSRVYVMMSGEKVGDLTTKRVRNNMNARSHSKLRALGG